MPYLIFILFVVKCVCQSMVLSNFLHVIAIEHLWNPIFVKFNVCQSSRQWGYECCLGLGKMD